MPNPYHHAADVLSFAAQQTKPYALVVVTTVTGGAMRAPGALMCVAENGDVAGYISNGCVDADIIFQARQAIGTGEPVSLAYGEGSPFMDIKLPCGGRIDLRIVPNPPQDIITDLAESLSARESGTLVLDGVSTAYDPKLKLRIVGRGEAVRSLARQGQRTGFDVCVQSPEESIVSDLDIAFTHLSDPADLPPANDDAWTAVVLMFHDHEWEPDILIHALSGPAFYIGAMGSQRTHALRRQTLTELGVSLLDIDRIRGPIGLIPSMRDANLLALSTLAEIVSTAQEGGRL